MTQPFEDPRLPHFSIMMDDGQLAWPVAEANGVTLEVFYHRLSIRWSAQKAATHPAPSRQRRSPPQRPSLKLSTFLADGRLAWPVAASRGVSQALFYARLKQGMTPDEVAFMPVMPRGWRHRHD
jgi:hypothetical protein